MTAAGNPYAEVIGDPIDHSLSPRIHNFWLTKLGLEGIYRTVRVTGTELQEYLSSRRHDSDWRGCNVTSPHKERIRPLLDRCDFDDIGAINCVLPRGGLLIGRNTDDAGVDAAFYQGVETSLPICLIGAGGAARAAVASLDVLAVYQFNVIVRDIEKGRKLIEGYTGEAFPFEMAAEALQSCAGVINASPLGMTGCPKMPPVVLDGLVRMDDDAFVFDMVYSPLRTDLLLRGEKAGFQTIDGLTMLIGQAEHSFFHFFGAPAPRQYDLELRRLLTA